MRRTVFALLGACALAGCAAQPGAMRPEVPADPTRLRNWTASGRIAVAAGDVGGSGSFVWDQRETSTRLGLRGPLGAGAIEVISTPDQLSVSDGSGRAWDAGAAQAELRARLGADLPWPNLRYWMLGLPSPDEPATVREHAQAPRRVIEQAGWTIGYDTYTQSAGWTLPERFTATRGGVRVKVIVNDWNLLPRPGSPGDGAP